MWGLPAAELSGSPYRDGVRMARCRVLRHGAAAITDACARVPERCWGMASQASSAGAGVARGPVGRGLLRDAFGVLVEHRSRVLAGIAAVSIVAGGVLYLAGEHSVAQDVRGRRRAALCRGWRGRRATGEVADACRGAAASSGHADARRLRADREGLPALLENTTAVAACAAGERPVTADRLISHIEFMGEYP